MSGLLADVSRQGGKKTDGLCLNREASKHKGMEVGILGGCWERRQVQ